MLSGHRTHMTKTTAWATDTETKQWLYSANSLEVTTSECALGMQHITTAMGQDKTALKRVAKAKADFFAIAAMP